MHAYPPMPVEICRYILEIAAELAKDVALKLALLSKTVRGW